MSNKKNRSSRNQKKKTLRLKRQRLHNRNNDENVVYQVVLSEEQKEMLGMKTTLTQLKYQAKQNTEMFRNLEKEYKEKTSKYESQSETHRNFVNLLLPACAETAIAGVSKSDDFPKNQGSYTTTAWFFKQIMIIAFPDVEKWNEQPELSYKNPIDYGLGEAQHVIQKLLAHRIDFIKCTNNDVMLHLDKIIEYDPLTWVNIFFTEHLGFEIKSIDGNRFIVDKNCLGVRIHKNLIKKRGIGFKV